jgi:hypothetical protein
MLSLLLTVDVNKFNKYLKCTPKIQGPITSTVNLNQDYREDPLEKQDTHEGSYP